MYKQPSPTPLSRRRGAQARLCVSASKLGLVFLMLATGYLTLRLLSIGVLVRGGITKGKLHHTDKAVFGPAFLVAYALESEVAVVPRILLDRLVHEEIRNIRTTKLDQFPTLFSVKLDPDGPPSLDYLGVFRGPRGLAWATMRDKCRASLQRCLNDAIYQPRHFAKVKWLADYWNEVVMDNPSPDNSHLIQFPLDDARWQGALQKPE